MPEGDTIHRAAARVGAALTGTVPDEIATPHPRLRGERWPQRLAGRAVTGVGAHGKHLFLEFEGDYTIHSHLRMTGSWRVHDSAAHERRAARRAWLTLRSGPATVVQFDGPVLELMTTARRRLDRRLAALGPDVLAPDFAPSAAIARIRADAPTRTLGDALIDQHNVAGIGNIWKSESCFAAGIDPWRPLSDVADVELAAVLAAAAQAMAASVRDGHGPRDRAIYRRAGMPCPRCGATVLARGQGDDNRTTYWCPTCQR